VLAPAVPLAPVIYADWNNACILVSMAGLAAFIANLMFYHGMARDYTQSLTFNRRQTGRVLDAAVEMGVTSRG